jgi:hypothetical protein
MLYMKARPLALVNNLNARARMAALQPDPMKVG